MQPPAPAFREKSLQSLASFKCLSLFFFKIKQINLLFILFIHKTPDGRRKKAKRVSNKSHHLKKSLGAFWWV